MKCFDACKIEEYVHAFYVSSLTVHCRHLTNTLMDTPDVLRGWGNASVNERSREKERERRCHFRQISPMPEQIAFPRPTNSLSC